MPRSTIAYWTANAAAWNRFCPAKATANIAGVRGRTSSDRVNSAPVVPMARYSARCANGEVQRTRRHTSSDRRDDQAADHPGNRHPDPGDDADQPFGGAEHLAEAAELIGQRERRRRRAEQDQGIDDHRTTDQGPEVAEELGEALPGQPAVRRRSGQRGEHDHRQQARRAEGQRAGDERQRAQQPDGGDRPEAEAADVAGGEPRAETSVGLRSTRLPIQPATAAT